jgi:hypothetical protein
MVSGVGGANVSTLIYNRHLSGVLLSAVIGSPAAAFEANVLVQASHSFRRCRNWVMPFPLSVASMVTST